MFRRWNFNGCFSFLSFFVVNLQKSSTVLEYASSGRLCQPAVPNFTVPLIKTAGSILEILTLHVFWKKVQGSNSINRMRDVPFYRKVSTMPHFFLTDVEKMTGLILSFLSFFDVLCVKKKLFVYIRFS